MKRVLFVLCVLTLAVGCGSKSEKKNAEKLEIKETKAPYKVGDLYYEDDVIGIVFEVTHGGIHGKIVSLDEEKMRWCDSSVADELFIYNEYDGGLNTEHIMWQYNAEMFYAAQWCANYGDGWYLPAINELKSINKCTSAIDNTLSKYGLETIGGRQNANVYFSSTEAREYTGVSSCVRVVCLGSNEEGSCSKTAEGYVRAVYKF